jgi:hypothetical protein
VLAPWPPADCVYSCYGFAGLRLHPQLVLHLALLVVHHALLVTGILSSVEQLLR